MPLPAGFPPPPKPPDPAVPKTDRAWDDYFNDLTAWLKRLMAAIP